MIIIKPVHYFNIAMCAYVCLLTIFKQVASRVVLLNAAPACFTCITSNLRLVYALCRAYNILLVRNNLYIYFTSISLS